MGAWVRLVSLIALAFGLAACGSPIVARTTPSPEKVIQSLLARPLLAPVDAARPCVPTRGHVASSFSPFGSTLAIGGGPVYALVAYSSTTATMSVGKNKVLWFAAPAYQGPIAIRTAALPLMDLVTFYGSPSLVLTSGDALGADGASYPPASKGWRHGQRVVTCRPPVATAFKSTPRGDPNS
jgi:hypothetical protein